MPSTPELGVPEIIDPHGDLQLIVGGSKVVFQVCSRALARSSPVWNNMLYGQFSEGKEQQNGDLWEVPLQEDDPDALRIILFIVHCNFEAVLTALPFDLFFRLTVLSDKYDMVASLKHFWRGWNRWGASESQLLCMSPGQLTQRLWISHTLGDAESFHHVIIVLVSRAVAAAEGRLFIGDPALEDAPYELDWDECLWWLAVLDQVKRARCAAIRKVYRGVRDAMESLTSSSPSSAKCNAPQPTVACDCAMLGAIHRALATTHAELWYSDMMDDAEDCTPFSVCELKELFQDLFATIAADGRLSAAHARCNPWAHTQLFNFEMLPEIRSLTSDYAEHIRKQAEKSGLDSELHEW